MILVTCTWHGKIIQIMRMQGRIVIYSISAGMLPRVHGADMSTQRTWSPRRARLILGIQQSRWTLLVTCTWHGKIVPSMVGRGWIKIYFISVGTPPQEHGQDLLMILMWSPLRAQV
ncbi:MAG: hypothetical protein ACFFDN_18600 [Candidatus Hodarchaeota archaeon]